MGCVSESLACNSVTGGRISGGIGTLELQPPDNTIVQFLGRAISVICCFSLTVTEGWKGQQHPIEEVLAVETNTIATCSTELHRYLVVYVIKLRLSTQ